jgi:hypothetical protein
MICIAAAMDGDDDMMMELFMQDEAVAAVDQK